ncbi:MAG: hypothetical protein AAF685_04990 [Cyanobacteria bacterium P01_C01_bin.89]
MGNLMWWKIRRLQAKTTAKETAMPLPTLTIGINEAAKRDGITDVKYGQESKSQCLANVS